MGYVCVCRWGLGLGDMVGVGESRWLRHFPASTENSFYLIAWLPINLNNPFND